MGPNSPLQNLNNFALAMEYCTVLEQRTGLLQMVKQERVVQILKSAINQAHLTNADVDTVIANHF